MAEACPGEFSELSSRSQRGLSLDGLQVITEHFFFTLTSSRYRVRSRLFRGYEKLIHSLQVLSHVLRSNRSLHAKQNATLHTSCFLRAPCASFSIAKER